jgi:oligopeptide/dipeptide ABC transporter ATP-binding protein
MMDEPLIKPEILLEVESLRVGFPTRAGLVRAADGVNFSVRRGESWCLIGESGCGKTVVAMSLLRLLPPGAIVSGRVEFQGQNLLSLSSDSLRRVRGRKISMIFEQPGAYLNPVFPIGDQIAEAVRTHVDLSRSDARKKTLELLDMVGIPSPEKRLSQYPHQLSGGMNQRVMIAMALAFKPVLLVADEPTTSLDPTVQTQILELIRQLAEQTGTTLLLITHDYAVATELCDHAAVMYAGRIMETGTTDNVFQQPAHPYTRAMLSALEGDEPRPIPGHVPPLTRIPNGCRFHPRCRKAREVCSLEEPEMKDGVRCHLI